MMTNTLKLFGIVGMILLTVILLSWITQSGVASGSVFQGNEYNATTTNSIGSQPLIRVLKTGQGSLAQVTITGAAAGTLNFYNATTSDSTKRDSTQATTSILMASFPASTAAGTYTFDLVVTRGLLMIQEATAPTSTVMWR